MTFTKWVAENDGFELPSTVRNIRKNCDVGGRGGVTNSKKAKR